MSDSVGKISLELEVTSDLQKQISTMAEMMGKQIASTLSRSMGNLKLDKMLSSFSNQFQKQMDSIMAGLSAGTKKIKLPKQFSTTATTPASTTTPATSPIQPRAPNPGKFATLNKILNQVYGSSNRASNGLLNIGNSAKKSEKHIMGANNSMKFFIATMFKWGIIYNLVMKVINGMAKFLADGFMANQQFANSLAQIRTNLYVAFMPIYQAVLPAINALMAGLARVTAYIAVFTNAIFGKTYQQSFQAAKGLIAAKTAMGAYGNAAKKAGKDAKGALASFDEINVLNQGAGSDAGAGAGSGVPQMVMPPVDVSPTSTVTRSIEDMAAKTKAVLATIFQPMKNAWAKDGAGVMAEFNRAINATKSTLGYFFSVLATPPVQSFIENITSLILAIIKLGLRIYDSFILPFVNWFVSLLPGAASGLNPIIEIITRLVNYLAGDGFVYVQLFLGAVIGLVAGIKTFSIVNTVIGWFNNFSKLINTVVVPAIKGVWAIMMANPIALVIAIIVGLIAVFVTLYATNENFRNKVNEVWASIKATFSAFGNWLKTAFATDWTTRFGVFGEVLNGFFAGAKNVFDSMKQIFNGIIEFISGVFTGNWRRAWQGVKDIFSGIMDGLGALIKWPLNVLIGELNTVIGGLNKIKLPNWDILGSAAGRGINIPKIPYLAKGGIIDQPTLAMVGERGKEAVMPLENNTGWIDNLASQLNSKSQGSDEVVKLLQMILDVLRNLGMDISIDGIKFGYMAATNINKASRQAGKTILNV